jgi:cell division protein FtsI/penicillin-binding protein 2
MITGRQWWAFGLGVAALTAPLVARRGAADARRDGNGRSVLADAGVAEGPAVIATPVPGFDPQRARLGPGGRFVAELPGGRRATLTLEPTWQRATQALLARYALPVASVVVLDAATARVLVWASRGAETEADLAREARAPAASVFKIVTATALYQRGFAEDAVTCWSGGFHALRPRDLVADPRRDRECSTLPEAFARSINTVFGRRALELLRPADELSVARQWGFGEAVPFDAPVSTSAVTVPDDTLGFARTAAGFWNSTLSPLHGALLAQGVARDGMMSRPWIVESVRDARGAVVARGEAQTWRRATEPAVATALSRAMLRSVSEGTAFNAFHDPARRPFLEGVIVGGKTGTLTAAQPFRAWTWFVGNAQGAGRALSFAVLVGNDPLWRVKAPTLARQVLQIAFRGRATD